jgi:hypothetical protein
LELLMTEATVGEVEQAWLMMMMVNGRVVVSHCEAATTASGVASTAARLWLVIIEVGGKELWVKGIGHGFEPFVVCIPVGVFACCDGRG